MIKKIKGNISFYVSEKLNGHSDVTHFFSTRNQGISKGVFESLNFGTHHGESENMRKNLSFLADNLNLDLIKFVIPKQTHGDIIGIVDETNYTDIFENTDALITNVPSIVIAIKTADCVPILLFDPVNKAIGSVHSGWKGTVQNIIGKTIAKMVQEFGANPVNMIAAIGPCIGLKSYEVGDDVIQRVKSVISDDVKVFNYENVQNGKALLDLTRVNFDLILQAGITEKNIDTSGLCTFTMKDDFFSARRDGNITGRMINGISIKSY